MYKKKGKVEVETDPYRIQKLKECCDILLAAGYFRARSPTISPFDKVFLWFLFLGGEGSVHVLLMIFF